MENNLVNEEYCLNFFKGKTVLILGSGPGVTSVTSKQMLKYDLICRVNNYTWHNENHKIDVYYSFLGNSIRKKATEMIKDNVKLIICKCPDENVIVTHEDGSLNQNLSCDTRYVYKHRIKGRFFIKPYHIINTEQYNAHNRLIGHICSSGTAAILDILHFSPKHIHIAGFDWFRSGKHFKGGVNLKPFPHRHYWLSEFTVIRKLVETLPQLTAQEDIMEQFANPTGFEGER
jgi:hypothetical protein